MSNSRPQEVDQALNIMKAMCSNFTPQKFWIGQVIRPIEQYIKALEQELHSRGIQASLELALRMQEGGENDEDCQNISTDSTRFLN